MEGCQKARAIRAGHPVWHTNINSC